MPQKTVAYRGRFAPSPNGPLHFGSLIAATASYLDALHHGGQWWVRIDDLDPPRVIPGMADHILHTLEAFGFEWDGVVYQSQRLAHYAAALKRLPHYACYCNRREVFTRDPSGGYHGFCRVHTPLRTGKPPALRFQLPAEADHFKDLIQGEQHCQCRQWPGEFVLKRADGIYAYHLACAVDEIEMGITHVLRGADLLQSSFPQRLIIQALGKTPPLYGHHPIAVNTQKIKLSKRSKAPPIHPDHARKTLWQALDFLGQKPPLHLKTDALQTLWQWAQTHYNRQLIPTCTTQPYEL